MLGDVACAIGGGMVGIGAGGVNWWGAAPPVSNDLFFVVLTSAFPKFVPIVLENGQLRSHAES